MTDIIEKLIEKKREFVKLNSNLLNSERGRMMIEERLQSYAYDELNIYNKEIEELISLLMA